MLNLVNFAEIFEGKLDETNFENTGTELQMPDWPQFLLPEHFLPLICYFFVTKLIAFLVRISLWKDVRGFKQYRLRNLTVSLIHSIITGGAALIFANIHPFAIFTYELLSHHLSVFFFFTTTICSRKFVPFAYVALLLEVNGICLHIRTLMQISGNSVKRPKLYKLVMYTNIITLWKDVRGFKQYRLRNLTVSLIHSIITGGAALIFANVHPFAMFVEPMHWYQPWSRHVVLFSMAYFVHDSYDMLKYETSRFTYELLSHHLSVFFFFTTTICSRKFIPFAYVALLLEVNGICLHIRTLMQISGNSVKRPKLYKLVMYTNIVTFLVFRFGVQAWQVQWVYHRRFEMHYIFLGIGFIGSAFFLIINAFLFFRILAADGYLGEFGRKHAAINRDKQIHEKSD
uniref:TLC domain-containing protein n=1 Tax=Panagrolaimus sp. JU765 TaxID=591449 RepID=A0AC34QSE6_9BILA